MLDTVTLVEFDMNRHRDFIQSIRKLDQELDLKQIRLLEQYDLGGVLTEDKTERLNDIDWMKMMLNSSSRIFVGVYLDKCISFLHATPNVLSNDSIHIGNFIVAKKYTGRGFGRSLLSQFEILVKANYSAITLTVIANNKVANKLYNNDGFVPFGYRMVKIL